MLSSSVRAPSRKTTTSIVPTIELIAVRRRYSRQDRKSTRLNSSHSQISYAVFCLKKKKKDSASLNSPRRVHVALAPDRVYTGSPRLSTPVCMLISEHCSPDSVDHLSSHPPHDAQ